ncbi:MAG: histidine kinase N-terminal 7TM domain-containing protein [Patescibacteria group bacterium]|jgi:hypothetical protein
MLRNLIIISTFLMTVSAFGLGIFTIVKSPKSKVNVTWFFTSLAVTIWGIGYLLAMSTRVDSVAFWDLRIVYIGASAVPVLFFHFVASFLFKDIKYKLLIILGYILGVGFLFLNTTTELVIKGVRYLENFGRYEEITTIGFKIFLAYFLFFAAMGIYLLFKGYRENGGIRRQQIVYIILASLCGFVGGSSNFVTDLTGIYPYGQMIVWLYPALITYGIFLR